MRAVARRCRGRGGRMAWRLQEEQQAVGVRRTLAGSGGPRCSCGLRRPAARVVRPRTLGRPRRVGALPPVMELTM